MRPFDDVAAHWRRYRKSFQLQYIDWERPENNVYHVTDEFKVHGLNHPRKPDVVLFVNGIPMAVIECKRRDGRDPLDQAAIK